MTGQSGAGLEHAVATSDSLRAKLGVKKVLEQTTGRELRPCRGIITTEMLGARVTGRMGGLLGRREPAIDPALIRGRRGHCNMEHNGPVCREVHHPARQPRRDDDGIQQPQPVPPILDVDRRLALHENRRFGEQPGVKRIGSLGRQGQQAREQVLCTVVCANERNQLDPRYQYRGLGALGELDYLAAVGGSPGRLSWRWHGRDRTSTDLK